MDEVSRLRDQLRALGGVLHALARAEGLTPVLREIVTSASRLSRAEHGQIYLAEGDRFYIWADTPGI